MCRGVSGDVLVSLRLGARCRRNNNTPYISSIVHAINVRAAGERDGPDPGRGFSALLSPRVSHYNLACTSRVGGENQVWEHMPPVNATVSVTHSASKSGIRANTLRHKLASIPVCNFLPRMRETATTAWPLPQQATERWKQTQSKENTQKCLPTHAPLPRPREIM